MTESSTEKPATEVEKTEGKPGVTVPIGVVAEARAEKRAAVAEAEAAKAELAKQRETPKLDSELMALLAAEAAKMMEQRVAPLEVEAAEGRKFKLAVQLGLNEAQVNKVQEVRQQNPGLSNEDSLLIAKARYGDLFPASRPQWDRALHGGMPVSGNSDSRSPVTYESHIAKMNESLRSGDRQSAQEHAVKAFTFAAHSLFDRTHPQS